MPSWTLATLMSSATAALGNRSDIALSTVSLWTNEAYERLWTELPENEQEALAVSSTTVNEDKLTLPSDFLEMVAVSNTSNSNTLLDPINVDQLLAFSDSSGVPRYYALYSDWLELRPVPDSAYSLELRYRKLRSDMTATTSLPSIATRYHQAIFLKTAELLADFVTLDPEKADRFRGLYRVHMATTPNDRALRARNDHAMGSSLGRARGQKNTAASAYSFDRDI